LFLFFFLADQMELDADLSSAPLRSQSPLTHDDPMGEDSAQQQKPVLQTAPPIQPYVPYENLSASSSSSKPGHSNPFLRVRAAAKTAAENGVHQRQSSFTRTTLSDKSTHAAIRLPDFVSFATSPYELALEAASKIKPIVPSRSLEREHGAHPTEMLSFNMMTTSGGGGGGGGGGSLPASTNELPVKRKPGRPPKRRDIDIGAGPSGSVTSLPNPRTSMINNTIKPIQVSEAPKEVMKRDDDQKLSGWYEGLDNEDWSSEGSEEDEDLEAKMRREKEIEERKKNEKERKHKKRGRRGKERSKEDLDGDFAGKGGGSGEYEREHGCRRC
jgi:hypothetical protein